MADTSGNGRAAWLVFASYLPSILIVLLFGGAAWLVIGHINGPWHGAAGERHALTEGVLREHAERLAVVESNGVDDRFRGVDVKALWTALRKRDPTLPAWEDVDPR